MPRSKTVGTRKILDRIAKVGSADCGYLIVYRDKDGRITSTVNCRCKSIHVKK